MYFLKRALGTLLGPIPIAAFLILIGGLIRWRKPSRKAGPIAVGLGVVILGLASNNGFSELLIRSLEQQYAVIAINDEAPVEAEFIAVLGGGHVDNDQIPAVSRLAESSVARLVETVRLSLKFPQTQLITCGPIGESGAGNSHAYTLARGAIELGVNSDRITQVSDAHDTHDEILKIKKIVGAKPTIIVTSAWHMPRAMGLARKAGINAIASPSDYISRTRETQAIDWIFFSPHALGTTTRANREYLGLLWTWLRGQR